MDTTKDVIVESLKSRYDQNIETIKKCKTDNAEIYKEIIFKLYSVRIGSIVLSNDKLYKVIEIVDVYGFKKPYLKGVSQKPSGCFSKGYRCLGSNWRVMDV